MHFKTVSMTALIVVCAAITGCAVITELPFGTNCATLELKVNYIRSLGAGSPRLSCIGTVLHLGRRSAAKSWRWSGRERSQCRALVRSRSRSRAT